ncbi:hypothetical protein [Aurantimonas coralicida]|uniref:hypothetical protein n=1 Tax=Aurantimonas coralicida TaxID=182270 RepID=UPI001E49F729|nr:hypothetical protein [Aurantimonas coralicida]MCD1641350.1 hypothetical protein [Aurantimonas coralicida]
METVDPPLTQDEIAEGLRLSAAYLALVRAALSGYPPPPRTARRRRVTPPGRVGAQRGDRMLPSAAWLFAAICKRGACRRVRACRYGERPGDGTCDATGQPPAPCFEALPRAVHLALPFALQRQITPAAFRDPYHLRREAEAIRAARSDVAAMRGGGVDASVGALKGGRRAPGSLP